MTTRFANLRPTNSETLARRCVRFPPPPDRFEIRETVFVNEKFANNRDARATVEQIMDRHRHGTPSFNRNNSVTSPPRLCGTDIATFPSTKLLAQISVRAEWLLYRPKPRAMANKKRSCSNIYSRYIGQPDVTCCWFLSFDSKRSVSPSIEQLTVSPAAVDLRCPEPFHLKGAE